jgi:DNA-binding beta-propeller fold protein YncE
MKQLVLTPVIFSSLFALAGGACSVENASSEPAPGVSSSPVLVYEGFAAPERVLYDGARDRYLVSNVNGAAADRDGNGFISVLSPDGTVTELHWITGGQSGVTLDAPKGLALLDDVLYVADIDVVRRFDADTGEPLAAIPVPGSTFLNGLSAGPDGQLYLTDSGPPQGTLDAVGTESVYVIEGDEVRQIAGGELGRPTSVHADGARLIVASFGKNEVYELDARGNRLKSSQLPASGLAGVVKHGQWLFVSSFQGSAVYRGKVGNAFDVALSDVSAPADLGYDSERRRLLIPHFTENTVEAFAIE